MRRDQLPRLAGVVAWGLAVLPGVLLSVGLWEWGRHLPEGQCYGLASWREIGLHAFLWGPLGDGSAVASAENLAILLGLLAAPLVSLAVVLWRPRWWSCLAAVPAWLPYHLFVFAWMAAGC